jgi:DNA-directed RNA polymerase subunit K
MGFSMVTKKSDDKKDFKFTKFEKARLIGSRALQISQGAPFLMKFSKKELEKMGYDVIEIARREFEAGVLPIEIKRRLPHMQD